MCIRLGLLLISLLSLPPRAAGQPQVSPSSAPPALPVSTRDRPEHADAPRPDGYRGIWFTLGQFSEHGDKYSGGLGTYPANHVPLAVYSPKANKTFFTYGGTTPGQRHLLIMASYYDHQTGQVPRPVIVHDKQGVNDPHDNAALNLDEQGHVCCNLYFVQTDDGGATWTTAVGRPVELPLREVNNPALVLESESEGSSPTRAT